jgi:hypothetical protein
MQTFLPYQDFEKCFKILDYQRLGKQRVEAMQIINILEGKTSKWSNHPAVKMWEGYTSALMLYTNLCIFEWIKRGYKNTMQIYPGYLYGVGVPPPMPWWMGNEKFHRAMRSRLIKKNPKYYEPLFLGDKGYNDSKYWWPVMENKTFRII